MCVEICETCATYEKSGHGQSSMSAGLMRWTPVAGLTKSGHQDHDPLVSQFDLSESFSDIDFRFTIVLVNREFLSDHFILSGVGDCIERTLEFSIDDFDRIFSAVIPTGSTTSTKSHVSDWFSQTSDTDLIESFTHAAVGAC